MSQPSNRQYQAVHMFDRRNGITFVLPERMYDELTVNASVVETPPIDTANEEGRREVTAPLDYSQGLVSRTMDGVQRYIANADDRPADEIARANPALAGVATHAFVDGTADQAYIYTTDTLAGEKVHSGVLSPR